ncbi:MAG: hypothetical protein JNM25_06240 [Planctomycetes bacterium]|nr:hypothetical protein [Planctomycetota bacterium]
MRTCPEAAAGPRAGERGAILLVVLILSVTISLLSMALISTAEVSLRAEANADELDRAERGARSGIEWGAAAAKAYGIVPFGNSVVLDTGVEVRRQTRAASGPRLVGTGVSNGASVTVGANLQALETTRPYAFLSFGGTSKPSDSITVNGLTYLGEPNTPLQATKPLLLSGDLDLVSTTTLPASQVTHSAGVDNYGVGAIAMPAWDTSAFTTAANWKVPYTAYSGTTTLKDVTLNGLVVVTLAAGQKLRLENVVFNGTLVVPWLYPPVLDFLGTPTIEVKDLTMVGGTAETGNLAILAPGCAVTKAGPGGTSTTVSGVCFVRELDGSKSWNQTGKMLVRLAVASTGGAWSFTRPADFVPDVPVGIQWSGSQMAIRWLGRQ